MLFFPSFISIVHVVRMIKKIPSRLDQDSCHSTHKACVSAQSLSLCCSSAEPHLTSSASLYPSSTHTHSVWFKPLEQTASWLSDTFTVHLCLQQRTFMCPVGQNWGQGGLIVCDCCIIQLKLCWGYVERGMEKEDKGVAVHSKSPDPVR